MKQTKRALSLLICLALFISLAGCKTKPADSTATQDPSKAEREYYAQMRKPIDDAPALSLNIESKKITSVGNETFIERTEQTVICTGLGTDTPQAHTSKTVTYDEAYTASYEEVFADNTLYIQEKDGESFYGKKAAEEYMRQLPAIVLDEANYKTITKSDGKTVTTLKFSEPTAGESWALPEGATLEKATGTATIRDGALAKTAYDITYRYGSATVTLQVAVAAKTTSETVSVPEDTKSYTKLDAIDAVNLSNQGFFYLTQAKNAGINGTSTVICQAAGAYKTLTFSNYFQYENDKLSYKGNYTHNLTDLTTQKNSVWTEEDSYLNGKYVYYYDGKKADTGKVVAADVISSFQNTLLSNMLDMNYWKDVTAVDLGSVYLFECSFTNDIGDLLNEEVNLALYGDANFLDKYVSSFSLTMGTGYFAIDKYTGVPTSAGLELAGMQTIDGRPYLIRFQSDHALDVPCLSAYKEITGKLPEEKKPEETATPLMYKVTGKNGEEMWLLGTIHIGDARTGFLPQEVYDAFNNSDALALEFNMNTFEEQLENDPELQAKVASYYTYADGSTTDKHLDKELYKKALQYMKASGNNSVNTTYFKASIWWQALSNFFLKQGYALTAEQGMDNRLLTLAEEKKMKVLDVESGEEQLKMLTDFSDELQEFILKSTLSEDPCSYWQETYELYEEWCKGDETDLRKLLSEDTDTSEMTKEEKLLYQEYDKAMNTDRNKNMVKVATEYLESGDTVFFAVGLAHLLDDGGLIDGLKNAGYTVEQVKYAE